MPRKNLTSCEKRLLFLTILTALLSIVLSLCIGLILPSDFISSEGASKTSLSSYCKCNTSSDDVRLKLKCSLPIMQEFVQGRSFFEKPSSNPDFAYLASLSIPTYVDDQTERKFACSGVILSKEFVLVGQNCVNNDNAWVFVQVRVGSVFWSNGGTTHKVTDYYKVHYNGPVILKVDPNIEFSSITKAARMVAQNWNTASIAEWYKPNERKNKKFFLEQWTNKPCVDQPQVSGTVVNRISCNVKSNGAPLVTPDGLLVAFRLGTCESNNEVVSTFINLLDGFYSDWIKLIVLGKYTTADFIKILPHLNDEKVTKIYELHGECTRSDTVGNITKTHFSSAFRRYKFDTTVSSVPIDDFWEDDTEDYEDSYEQDF